MFQEGTIYPGIKLYSRGEPVADIHRAVLANSRLPKTLAGDLSAQVTGVRAGAEGLVRVVERFGLDAFRRSVARMYDHGEAVVRDYFERIPTAATRRAASSTQTAWATRRSPSRSPSRSPARPCASITLTRPMRWPGR